MYDEAMDHNLTEEDMMFRDRYCGVSICFVAG